jgi:DHA1 family tetracycline resistance protein-like MFS transporter
MKSVKFSLFILLIIDFIDWMGIGLVYPMFSSMIYHTQIEYLPINTPDLVRGTWLGILLAASPVAQFFSSPVIGVLSDQKGRKPTFKVCLLIAITGYLICALSVYCHNLYLLLFGRIIVGLGSGSVAAVYATIADISEENEKTRAFGLINMASGIGFTIGPFLGGKLSQLWGFDTPFLFSALINVLSLILVIWFFQETLKVKKKGTISLVSGLLNMKKIFKIKGMGALFMSFFFFSAGWSFYWEFIPVTWIQGYKLTTTQVGDFYAYGAAIYAISCGLLIRPIVDNFKPLSILFYGLLISGFMILVLLLHTSISWFWVYIPIQQYCVALIFPTGSTFVSNSASADSQGEVMGLFQSLISFSFAASPLIAGTVVGLSYSMPIVIGGLAMLMGSLSLLVGYRKKIFLAC